MTRPSREQLDRLKRDARRHKTQVAADAAALEARRQAAIELVEALLPSWEDYQAAGEVPPDPPPCTLEHAAGSCDQCVAWQTAAHAITLSYATAPDGTLTHPGSMLYSRNWPLRADTIQLLEDAKRREPPAEQVLQEVLEQARAAWAARQQRGR